MKYAFYLMILIFVLPISSGFSQDKEIAKDKIERLQDRKANIINSERAALKDKVQAINEQLHKELITQEEADAMKKKVAEQHASNINDRIAIIDKNIALLQRNNGLIVEEINSNEKRFDWGLGHKNENDERIFGIRYKRKNPKPFKYDQRISSDFVMSAGINTAVGGYSKAWQVIYFPGFYYEVGWMWRYRVYKNNNRLRLNFGFNYQRNVVKGGLTPLFEINNTSGNGSGITVDGVFYQQTDENTSVIRTKTSYSNFVFPLHFEVGPSKVRKTSSSIRYSSINKFRIGLGGYVGLNLGLTQRVDFNINYGVVPHVSLH